MCSNSVHARVAEENCVLTGRGEEAISSDVISTTEEVILNSRDPVEKSQGYDFDFVDGLDPKYECAICLLCQRDPMQTPCGHRFCGTCIVMWFQKGRNMCPVDNKIFAEDKIFFDNCAKREILALLVRCPNKANGCEKTLEVREVEQHLLTCSYTKVPCPNGCSKLVLRHEVESHRLNDCWKRIIPCKLCFKNFPLNEQQNHFAVCPLVTLPCECGKILPRQLMDEHRLSECPSAIALCFYYEFGCTEKLRRVDLENHLKSNIEKHLELVTNAFKEMRMITVNQNNEKQFESSIQTRWLEGAGDSSPEIENLCSNFSTLAPLERTFLSTNTKSDPYVRYVCEKNVQLEQKTRELEIKLEGSKGQVKKLQEELSKMLKKLNDMDSRFCNGVHYWKIVNFSQLRVEAAQGHNRVLHSPGFYTSCYGYKVCLRLNVQGSGQSAFVSLFIHLMQGDYDNILSWPFVGKITMSILDQNNISEPKQDITETMHTKPGLTAFRKPTTDRNPKGFGYTEFVTVETLLEGPFVKNDSIMVRAIVTI